MKQTQTNWFALKTEDDRKKMLKICEAHNIFVKTAQEDGIKLHSFECFGYAHEMLGGTHESGVKISVLEAIQPLLADDHAMIVMEMGETLKGDMSGLVYVYTNKNHQMTTLAVTGMEMARNALDDLHYQPRFTLQSRC